MSSLCFCAGADSLRDVRDDVFPGWVRVTLVVDRGPNHASDAFLTEPLGREDKTMVVSRTDRLPDPEQARYLKVGPEWVRFSTFGSQRVIGLRRGQRGTSATAHKAGTSVRAGRELVFPLKVAHGRDSDD